MSPSKDITNEVNTNGLINLSLLDAPRWGWCAYGGVIDLCPPHERSRRKGAQKEYLQNLKKARILGKRKRTQEANLAKKNQEERGGGNETKLIDAKLVTEGKSLSTRRNEVQEPESLESDRGTVENNADIPSTPTSSSTSTSTPRIRTRKSLRSRLGRPLLNKWAESAKKSEGDAEKDDNPDEIEAAKALQKSLEEDAKNHKMGMAVKRLPIGVGLPLKKMRLTATSARTNHYGALVEELSGPLHMQEESDVTDDVMPFRNKSDIGSSFKSQNPRNVNNFDVGSTSVVPSRDIEKIAAKSFDSQSVTCDVVKEGSELSTVISKYHDEEKQESINIPAATSINCGDAVKNCLKPSEHACNYDQDESKKSFEVSNGKLDQEGSVLGAHDANSSDLSKPNVNAKDSLTIDCKIESTTKKVTNHNAGNIGKMRSYVDAVDTLDASLNPRMTNNDVESKNGSFTSEGQWLLNGSSRLLAPAPLSLDQQLNMEAVNTFFSSSSKTRGGSKPISDDTKDILESDVGCKGSNPKKSGKNMSSSSSSILQLEQLNDANIVGKKAGENLRKFSTEKEESLKEKRKQINNNDKNAIKNVETHNDLISTSYKLTTVNDKNSENDPSDKEKEETIKVVAMNEGGQLHCYAYHRGVAGDEPRDEESGELLCEIEPTDTNHFWDEPELKLKIIVSFALADPELSDTDDFIDDSQLNSEDKVPKEENTPKRGLRGRRNIRRIQQKESCISVIERKRRREEKMAEIPHFRDEIEWDLADPTTPTPMVFAADIAAEFGLSFCQTLDLAASIQSQIDEFCKKNNSYQMPISTEDPMGIHREDGCLQPPGFVLPKILHGGHRPMSITQTMKPSFIENEIPKVSAKIKSNLRPGFAKSRGADASSVRKRALSGVRSNSKSFEVCPQHLLPRHGDNTPQGRKKEQTISYSVEQKYIQEVLRRAKAECTAKIKEMEGETNDEKVGKLEIGTNYVCHICHARKPECAIFACGNTKHSYCDFHCSTRLGFRVSDLKKGFTLNYCPICCVQCICAKCARRVDSVASTFKGRCLEEGVSVNEVSMEVLGLCAGTNQPIMKGAAEITEKRKFPKSVNRREKKENPEVVDSTCDKAPPSCRRGRGRKIGDLQLKENCSEPIIDLRGGDKIKSSIEQIIESKRPKRKHKIDKIVQNADVPKVPRSEFPLEIIRNINADPALENDYNTVFTPNGSYLSTSTQDNNDSFVDKEEKKSFPSTNTEEDGNVDYCLVCNNSGGIICCDRCPRAFHDKCLNVNKNELPDPWECPRCSEDCLAQTGEIMGGEKSLHSIHTAFKKMEKYEDFTEKVLVLSKIHEMLNYLMNFDFGYVFNTPVDCNTLADYREIVECPMDLGTISSGLLKGVYVKRAKKYIKNDKNQMEEGVTIMDAIILEVLKDIETVWHNCLLYNCEGSAVYRMAEVQRNKCNAIQRCSFDEQLNSYIRQNLGKFVETCKGKRQKIVKVAKSWLPHSKYEIHLPFSTSKSRPVAVLDPDSFMLVKLYSSTNAAQAAAMFLYGNGHESEFDSFTSPFVKALIKKSSDDPSQRLFGYRWLFLDDLRKGNFEVSKDTKLSESLATEKKKRVCDLPSNPASETSIQSVGHISNYDTKLSFSPEPFTPIGTYFIDDGAEVPLDEGIVVIKKCVVTDANLGGFQSENLAFEDWLESRRNCPTISDDNDDDNSYVIFKKHYLHGKRTVNNVMWKPVLKGKNSNSLSTKIEDSQFSSYATSNTDNSRHQSNHALQKASNTFSFSENRREGTIQTSQLSVNGTKSLSQPSTFRQDITGCEVNPKQKPNMTSPVATFDSELNMGNSKRESAVSNNSVIPLPLDDITTNIIAGKTPANNSTSKRTDDPQVSPSVNPNEVYVSSEHEPAALQPALAAARKVPIEARKGPKKVIAIDMETLQVIEQFDTIKIASEHADTNDNHLLFSKKMRRRCIFNKILYAFASERDLLLSAMKEATGAMK